MINVRTIGALAVALVMAACGEVTVEATDTTAMTATATAETTLPPKPATTGAPVTTTASDPTTTTGAPAPSEAYAVLLDRVQRAGEPTSARMEGSVAIVGLAEAGGMSEIVLPFSISFDGDTGDSSFSMDMSGMADAVEEEDLMGFGAMFGAMEIRTIGDIAYLKFGFFTAMMGAETEWVSMPAEEGADFGAEMQQMPSDPSTMLEGYEGANAEVILLGRETVNGVEADHYLLTIDAASYLEELSPSERAELEANGPIPNGDLPMELWITDEGHVVRMLMDIDGTTIDHATPEEAFERMTFTFDVFDINQPVSIEAPSADQVTSVEDLESAFEFGG